MKTWLRYASVVLFSAVSLQAWAAADLMPVEHWQRDGLSVYRVYAQEVPMTKIVLLFDAGAVYDKKAGEAYLTAALLDQGAKGLSEAQLVSALGDQGSVLSVGTSLTQAWVAMQCTSQAWSSASQLLVRVLDQPAFSEKAIARRQQQMISELRMQSQSPGYLASLSFRQHLFARGPLRHAVLSGSQKNVMGLKRENVQDFYRQHFGARNASLLVVGQADHASVDGLAHRLSQVLPATEAVQLPASQVMDREHMAVIREPFKSQQNHVVVGQVLPGLHMGDADYWPLVVANDILGGSGLNARLFEAVRNQRGLAYSVSSGFMYFPGQVAWQMSMQSNHHQASEASRILLQSAEALIKQGPNEDEVNAAKQHLMGALPLQFDSNAKRMQRLVFLVSHHLPLDWYAGMAEHIRHVTVAQVKQAMQTHWQPQAWLMVTVGPQTAEKP